MSLYKLSSSYYTAGISGSGGIAGHPAIPAYCETRDVSQCSWVPNPALTWQWELIPEWNGIPAHYDNVPYVNGIKLVPPSSVQITLYKCGLVPVTTCHAYQPAVTSIPAVPASPAQYRVDKNLGWTNGRARSIAAFAVGTAIRFRVDPSSLGVFVGLGMDGQNTQALETFAHGLMIDGNGVRVYEDGVFVNTLASSFSGTTEFLISRPWSITGAVTYAISGGSSYSSTIPALGPMYAYAALYSGGDIIPEAGYEAVAAATIYDAVVCLLSPFSLVGFETGYTLEEVRLVLSLPTAVVTDDENYGFVSISLPTFTSLFSEYDYAEVRAAFSVFTATAVGDEYVPPMPDQVDAVLNSVYGLAYDFGPFSDSLSASLKPVNILLSEFSYNEVRATTPALAICVEEDSDPLSMYVLSDMLGYDDQQIVFDGVILLNSDGTFSSSFVASRVQIASLLSQFQVHDAYTIVGSFVVSEFSGASLLSHQVLGTSLDSIVWVINTETSASTRYTDYGFNSYFLRSGHYYGVAADGIYLLEGEDDAGIVIDSTITLGNTTAGTAKLKQVPAIYLGVTSSGKMLVKTEVDGAVRIYEARASRANLHNQRADLGKGVWGNNWTFSIMNQDGCDFDLASVEFLPIASSRRV